MNNRTLKTIRGLVLPIIVVVAWAFVTSRGKVSAAILPRLPAVGQTIVEMLRTGQLQEDLLLSLSRVVKGYAVAAVLGIVLGSLVGMFRSVREFLLPTITVIRQIPIIAWIPLIILWCGIGEMSKVVVIVLAAFFPILVNTENGMETTPEGYIEVARLYNLGKWETFRKVYLPHALPHILVGLKLGLGVSWMAVVAAEMIASTSGVGYRMSYARTLMQSAVVIVCMIEVGLVGILMDKVIGWIFGALTPWEKKQ